MTDAKTDAPVKFGGAYKESDTHVPDPTAMYDQFNTSGTGSSHVIEDVSPVFEVARKQADLQAANAIDPDHPEPASSLIFPDAQNLRVVDQDEIKDQVRARAEAAREPVVVGGPMLSERAAERSGDDGAAAAATETGNQGAGGSNVGSARREQEHHATKEKADGKPAAKTADTKPGDKADDK